jgi:hypothetical protein
MTYRRLLLVLAFFGLVVACASTTESTDDAGMTMPDASMQACPTGYDKCGDLCTVTKRDPENCGMCGKACAPGEVCVQGGCALQCAGGATKCGKLCANTKADPANCGMCGQICPSGQVCSSGKCQTSCEQGLTDCSGACLDLQSDDDNCGMCGSPCAAGQRCSMGKCFASCQMGWTSCPTDAGTTCADLTKDSQNCGSCGNACPNGQMCSGSMCGLTCFGGTTKCGNKCVDLMIDPQNCGACNTPCNGTCFNGMCCSGNLVYCNGQCRDLKTDKQNCGGCGIACGGPCNNGVCCNLNEVICSGKCANTKTDAQNCGGCSMPCPMNLPACVNGMCSNQPLYTYTESDIANQANGGATCTNWGNFVTGLPANGNGLSQVTFTGNANQGAITGMTCNTPAIVQALVTNLKAGTSYLSPTCNGHTWMTCGSNIDKIWVDAPSVCDGSDCPSPGWILRPCIANVNWGGANTATCPGSPSQTMTLTFQ